MPLTLLSLVGLALEELEVELRIGPVVAGSVVLNKDEVELNHGLVVDADGVAGPVDSEIVVTMILVAIDDVEELVRGGGDEELSTKDDDEPGAVRLGGAVPLLRERGGAVPVLELPEVTGPVPEAEVVPVVPSHGVVVLVKGGVELDATGVEGLDPEVIGGFVPEEVTPVLQTLDLEIDGRVRVLLLLALLELEKDSEVVMETDVSGASDEGKAEVVLNTFEDSVTTDVMVTGVVSVIVDVLTDDVVVGSVTEDDKPVEKSVSVPV
jgi:hypothetical protein